MPERAQPITRMFPPFFVVCVPYHNHICQDRTSKGQFSETSRTYSHESCTISKMLRIASRPRWTVLLTRHKQSDMVSVGTSFNTRDGACGPMFYPAMRTLSVGYLTIFLLFEFRSFDNEPLVCFLPLPLFCALTFLSIFRHALDENHLAGGGGLDVFDHAGQGPRCGLFGQSLV